MIARLSGSSSTASMRVCIMLFLWPGSHRAAASLRSRRRRPGCCLRLCYRNARQQSPGILPARGRYRQPGTGRRALHELVEDVGFLAGRYPPLVADRNRHCRATGAGVVEPGRRPGNRDAAADGGELDRVADQVAQYLQQPVRSAGTQAFPSPIGTSCSLRPAASADSSPITSSTAEAMPVGAMAKRIRPDSSLEIEQVVEQRHQPGAAVVNVAEIGLQLFRLAVGRARSAKMGKGEDAASACAARATCWRETATGTVGALGLFLRLLQVGGPLPTSSLQVGTMLQQLGPRRLSCVISSECR